MDAYPNAGLLHNKASGEVMKKHIHREVQFDALNMRTSRDIKCKGPVLNLGDTPQKWSITATVVVETDGGKMHHKFQFRPAGKCSLASLNAVVADELTKADYDHGAVVSIPVRAVILP